MPPENSLYLNQDMQAPEQCCCMQGSIAIFSTRCPEKSTDNEDSAAILNFTSQSGVLVVADGMGGGAGGEQASRIAVEAIKEELGIQKNNENALRAAILNGIELANQRILDLGIGAATTLAAVEIQNGEVRPYHVGDSSILVIGQRGKIKLQTVAHAPVSFAVEAGILDDDEALHHEDRHLVSNIIGTKDMRIEIGPTIPLSRFDTVLLATDGLFDNLSIEEIVNRIRKGILLDGLVDLIGVAHQRMNQIQEDRPSKPDDLTMLAYRQQQIS